MIPLSPEPARAGDVLDPTWGSREASGAVQQRPQELDHRASQPVERTSRHHGGRILDARRWWGDDRLQERV